MGLKEIVEQAADKLESGLTEEEIKRGEKAPAQTEEPEEPEEEEPTEEEPADDLDDLSLNEAKTLYKALKDPAKSMQVIAALAAQAGILQTPPATKVEEKAQKREIKDILKNALGTEYSFLADRLGTAIEEVVRQQDEDRALENQQRENARIASETASAMDKLARETKGESRKLEAKMVDLSTKLIPGKGISVEEFIRILYTQASAGATASNIKKDIADKVRRNANDVHARVPSAGGDKTLVFDPNKKYSLKESVAIAAKQIADQNNKRK